MLNKTLQTEVSDLLDTIRLSYAAYARDNDIDPNKREFFDRNLGLFPHGHYLRIQLANTNVWGFVVNTHDTRFNLGDVITADGYGEPSKNVRGNVFTGITNLSWTNAKVEID